MMRSVSVLRFLFVAVAAGLLALSMASAQGGERGAIAKILKNPLDTFGLNGMMGMEALAPEDLPPLSDISVDGFWPYQKFLLIVFQKDGFTHAYYIKYDAVQMADQARWDARMQAPDNHVICLSSRRPTIGDANGSISAATKGFTSPC